MIVTVTELGTFRRCRRKWQLTGANGMNLQPTLRVSKALDLGTLVHKTLATWVLDADADIVAVFRGHAAARVAELEQNYIKVVGASPSDEEIGPLLDAVELGEAMMRNYREHHGRPLPAHMSYVAPEQEIVVPIPGAVSVCASCKGGGQTLDLNPDHDMSPGALWTDCTECDGTGKVQHALKGTLDALVQDNRSLLYVLERKTYDRRPSLPSLDTNDQFLGYTWILGALDIGRVGGIAYDGMWKRAVPPRGSKMPDLFLRKVLPRSRHELDEFEQQLVIQVTEMYALRGVPLLDPRNYVNRRWEGCYECSVEPLCGMMSRGEDYERPMQRDYTQRQYALPMGQAAHGAGSRASTVTAVTKREIPLQMAGVSNDDSFDESPY